MKPRSLSTLSATSQVEPSKTHGSYPGAMKDTHIKVKSAKSAKDEEVIDLDEVMKPLGGFGLFQIVTLVQISIIVTIAGSTDLGYVFTAGHLEHRCFVPECENFNTTFFSPKWLNLAIPKDGDGSCTRFVPKPSANGCDNQTFTNTVAECKQFIYETDEWTVAREDWGINCESDRWMLSLIGSLNNAGAVVGTLFVGYLGDRFGRKLVIVSLAILVSIINVIKSFSISYTMFAAFEFISTGIEGGLYALPFVLALEMVDPSKRLLAGCIMTCAYPLGEVLVPLVQWLTLDWRMTLRILGTPYILVFIMLWTLPESPRWLLSKNRKDDLVITLKKIASMNRKTLSQETIDTMLAIDPVKSESAIDKKSEMMALFRSRRILIRYATILMVAIATLFTYFGMNLSAVSISSNKFIDSILSTVVEFPSSFLAIWLLGKKTLGRRRTLSGALFLCGVACVVFAYLSADWYWPRLILFLGGKFAIAIASLCMNVFVSELFPTTIRGTISSTAHTAGRIASILAPETPLLMVYYEPIPLLFFSAMATIGGALTLTLPETLNIKLPDTIKEAELLGWKPNQDKNKNRSLSEVD